ncbi:MAG TPA: bacillithiol biosynthesis deacetylase BshB1 [Candidatus Sumerlaeota bacterium]|nr:bacillithiol biosynthesis deacetylase BshB1 [Candidatus Sumerlaeota bacterium]HPK01927.1 bacillithiol biosynthesis deacetylase BshB1 [Candidatus Sumerlaeota bacterium]
MIDIVAFGAHADDAELFAAGTLALAARRGRSTAIVDLTRGEMATRGTPETRRREAQAAAGILALTHRETLDLGDGRLTNDHASRVLVASVIRRLRPTLVLTHGREDRHPDHRAAHDLVRDAAFFAYVGEFPADGERWRPAGLAFYLGNSFQPEARADWVVDISATYEIKMQALRAYASQFLADPAQPDRATYIASPEFWDAIERRSRLWGHRIGVAHGEPFLLDRPASALHPLVQLLPRP